MRRVQWQSYVKEDGGMAGHLFVFFITFHFFEIFFLVLIVLFFFVFFTQSLMTWKGTSESDVFLIGEP